MNYSVKSLRNLISEVISASALPPDQQVLRDYILEKVDSVGSSLTGITTLAMPETEEWYKQILSLSLQHGVVGHLAKNAWQTLSNGKLILSALASKEFNVDRRIVMKIFCAIARESLYRYMHLPGIERTLNVLEAWGEDRISNSEVFQAIDDLSETADRQPDLQDSAYITQANVLFIYMANLTRTSNLRGHIDKLFDALEAPGNWSLPRVLDADEVARIAIQFIPDPHKIARAV